MTDPTPNVRGLIERQARLSLLFGDYDDPDVRRIVETGDALAAALEARHVELPMPAHVCDVSGCCAETPTPPSGVCPDVAAALERVRYFVKGLSKPTEPLKAVAELERLLRAANFLAHSEGSPTPPPAATGDEELLTHWHDSIVPNAPSLSWRVTVEYGNSLATALRQRGADLEEMRKALAAATARAEEAQRAERRAAIEKCERLVIYYQSHGGVHSEAASMGCEDCISAIRGDLHFTDAGFITRPAPTGDKEEATK